ncbi:hypothetical protein P5673_016534 [Acropora cervicornis]|uniref:Uncharacterized protein n=1 Tax=Acropora cervicornis TaxID=6130 RepID=A0AAD9QGK5_ACRCE|nr:hypothetical protein P5673_016534 [Acropora cervicornis]
MSVPFKYVPPAALPVTSIADVIKSKKQGDTITVCGTVTKKQGDTITVCGTVKWNGDSKTPSNSSRKVRDGKWMDSSGVIDISIREDHVLQIKEGKFFQITNCKVKHFYGKKLSTSHETTIQPAEQQDITDAALKTAALKPCICCPEIQNVVINMHAICNTKACKTRITGNTESKNIVHCT